MYIQLTSNKLTSCAYRNLSLLWNTDRRNTYMHTQAQAVGPRRGWKTPSERSDHQTAQVPRRL